MTRSFLRPLGWMAGMGLLLPACDTAERDAAPPAELVSQAPADPVHEAPVVQEPEESTATDPWTERRHALVDRYLAGRDIRDPAVIRAMKTVPRHRFVPEELQEMAYLDQALPIGHDQTISQPYVVAFMTQAVELKPEHRVLEIGTGSGYQAAVLAEIAAEVYSIEIVEPLGKQAAKLLADLGYENIRTRIGDGYAGWPEAAPFDAVIVTAAPDHVPQPLIDQLGVGGRMIIPVGTFRQELRLLEKTEDGLRERRVLPVRFVPMTGEAQER